MNPAMAFQLAAVRDELIARAVRSCAPQRRRSYVAMAKQDTALGRVIHHQAAARVLARRPVILV